ncbi:MAG TPA: hypothetical protein VEH04_08495 [Verrucomicrobiae bacterium]|nr:hypothetical protein [Verrucomicrobiae bacterium]
MKTLNYNWRLDAPRLSLCFAAALVALFLPPLSAAPLVYETADEFHASGDLNGDGLADVLVLDKATGNVRVGHHSGAGVLTWSGPIASGVESVGALAIGRFTATNREAIAVTSPTLNRVQLMTVSNTVGIVTSMSPSHPGTTLLVALDSPYGLADDRDWLSAGSHDPGIMLLDLFAFLADGIATFSDQIAAEGFLDSGRLFRRSPGDISLVAAMRRGSNDTFVAYAFTNTAAPVLVRSNLPAGSEFVYGTFHNEPHPRVLFFVPGQSNVMVHSIVASPGGFQFGPGTASAFPSAVQQIFIVEEATNSMAVVKFGNGVAGMRPSAGGLLETVYQFGSGTATNVNAVVGLGTGRFAVLSRNSNSVSSVSAQVFSRVGTNYVAQATTPLPSITTSSTRGNVWLFQAEPFLSSAANMIGSLAAPVWSSGVIGFPGSLSVRVEADTGTATGLGNPATNNFGAPPAGTGYVLANQYRPDISFFGYAPPRTVVPSVITISPPPGSYGPPVQISFGKHNAADEVFYRINLNGWQNYTAPFALTNDAAIEYYGQNLSGERSTIQLASYDLGSTNPPAEPLIDLDGESGTNTPPVLSTNFLQISASGTVFYSRRSSLAQLSGFQGPSPYLSFNQGPFSGPGFTYLHLENFEDSAFNVPGASASGGWIVSGVGADSSDPGGRSYYSAGQTTLTITFNRQALGGRLPTHAGIVWTDVGQGSGVFGNGNVTFTALDANGASLGTHSGFGLGDFQTGASQGEDRFFGIVNSGGISSITISMPGSGDWEVDHLQYGHVDTNVLHGSIWAINLDGSGETFVTRGHKPRVSDDGRRMVFLRGDLWLRDLQTGIETPFFTNANASIVGFDWRRSQSDVVFDYGCSIWTRSLGGNVSSVPFPTDCFADAPVANPANDRLAYHVLGPNGPPGIHTTPPNWSAPTLLPLPVRGWRWPAWSPDGGSLLIADGEFSTIENRGTNLWIVNGDGSNLRQITALSAPGDGFPRGAIWKPDATCLVGSGRIGGTNGLWVIPLAANGEACHCLPRLLPTSPGDPIDFAGSIVVAQVPQPVANSGLFIRLEPNAAVVYWSTDFEGFTLEYTTNLHNASWTALTGPYFLNGGYYEYREPRSSLAHTRYFRLRYSGVMILTPAQPQLSLQSAGSQSVLNWPLAYAGFAVEVATNLAPNAVWRPLPGPYAITNGVFEVRRNVRTNAAEYYRLKW